MNNNCKKIRKAIHEYFDTGRPLLKHEKKHLLNCISCYSYKSKYEKVISGYNQELNRALDSFNTPDYSVIQSNRQDSKILKTIHLSIKIAAAIVITVSGIFLSNNFFTNRNIINENHILIERLFNEPLFDIDYNNNSILPSEWFNVTEYE